MTSQMPQEGQEANAREPRSATRVVLFGFYRYGNFGDDLMALIIYRHLSDAGFDVTVVGMTDSDAREFSVQRSEYLEDVLTGADAVVFGGGGLLCKASTTPQSLEYQQTIERILDHCNRTNTPIFGVSLGGSGHTKIGAWKQPALRLLRESKHCSFRNPEDLKIAHVCGRKEFKWHADIVWLTSSFFPRKVEPRERPVVGVNVVGKPFGKQVHRLLPIVLDYQSRADVVYFDTTHSAVSHFRGLAPRSPSTRSTRYTFSGLSKDLDFLAAVDLVITNRLHSGIAAMSYGASMVSFFGYGKTRLAMRNVCRLNNHINFRNCLSFMLDLRDPDKWRSKYAGLTLESLHEVQASAMCHLGELVNALDEIVPTKAECRPGRECARS